MVFRVGGGAWGAVGEGGGVVEVYAGWGLSSRGGAGEAEEGEGQSQRLAPAEALRKSFGR